MSQTYPPGVSLGPHLVENIVLIGLGVVVGGGLLVALTMFGMFATAVLSH